MAAKKAKRKSDEGVFLDGQLLVAMPSMPDERFARTVIYMCAHSSEGAMGIVINKKSESVTFPDLLVQLKVIDQKAAIRLPPEVEGVQVLRGGPMESGRGFVLHSDDFNSGDSTVTIDKGVCLTATLDILRAIADGVGPHHAALALGYASWGPGQLENELLHNGWLTGPADPALIFDAGHEKKYDRALKSMGVDPGFLSGEAGHA
ncbi:MAG: YqgE/AlgH family protein [Methylobacteriaceae bacterium]|nr:YqgE/AlgH family protein [Rhodoblastus sp.]MCC0004426.1 YqgE/AlgH family protein [Methylobacteriaceae bacterium]